MVKKVIAREGLIIIALILLSIVCFKLESWQSKDFDREGRRILNSTEIEKFNLFKPAQRKVEGFDPYTAIPASKPTYKLSQVTAEGFDPATAPKSVDTTPSREEYEAMAKEELLNRAGFSNLHSHLEFGTFQ